MTVDEFFDRLQRQIAVKKNIHKLAKPATEAAIANWLKRHPEFTPLPETFVRFLKTANGVVLLRFPEASEIGGRLRLYGLREFDFAAQVMMHGTPEDHSDLPAHFLGIGMDENHDWSPVLER